MGHLPAAGMVHRSTAQDAIDMARAINMICQARPGQPSHNGHAGASQGVRRPRTAICYTTALYKRPEDSTQSPASPPRGFLAGTAGVALLGPQPEQLGSGECSPPLPLPPPPPPQSLAASAATHADTQCPPCSLPAVGLVPFDGPNLRRVHPGAIPSSPCDCWVLFLALWRLPHACARVECACEALLTLDWLS